MPVTILLYDVNAQYIFARALTVYFRIVLELLTESATNALVIQPA